MNTACQASAIRCHALQWGPIGRPLTPPLDLDITSGTLTAVVGENGTGKTSLLRVLAGLQRPLAGRLDISLPRGAVTGFLQQQQAIDRQFPINLGELVLAGLWGQRLPRPVRQARLDAALAAWQLDGLARYSLAELSGGQLQRALLARLSLLDAPLLLLDEPEASLDEAGQRLLWRHLQAWQAEGKTLVMVCHDLASVRERAQWCLSIAPSACQWQPGAALRAVAC
ncbi:ATP-binding cassette domain-containing protein [Pseudomonas sp. DTU_2021_1001937_2_SI_NGA_ILE_001]|uniref:ATP-binding cassette domain-containing protein n=1 Tax=Pseudomonas sp. DTU_2021_1001937_2_SI_NGA_ILE_001 TaxID=3077589 RepID=UPI0028FC2E73|nr:ATP-binding cassette domain-containing protein [Pseudomonas sp. DTU_2021_1001937_2_SI_NGA_ILE_001]WNW10267.1 ATP-binding cassette domain-containing protein [Pseudomonas sp. DTU_2021_1001937_2_SI_NGA_ILE_001]